MAVTCTQKCGLVWLLLILMGCTLRRCDGASFSKQYMNRRRAGNGDGANILQVGAWASTVPSYALNWPQHQGTTEDLAEVRAQGISTGENDMLASWADTSAAASEDELDMDYLWTVTHEDIKKFKSNPCAPGRDCTHYEQAGYVFNSMTL
ncbi:hypothetical protein MPTK1_4g02470 [Marchantia polymorpha subsp. ruderalis]|nr:hypothetical protein MARPO_0080s0052 [Marchantia polymorpha]BBN07268.1 hypothetical protein Mp_4g02470 [Marchantia polymorpha subsp. ruderalis]|eukprot:PTQ34436.1 hypothetical protein MARPO_0080s0052 [Marchantia polymorpha]